MFHDRFQECLLQKVIFYQSVFIGEYLLKIVVVAGEGISLSILQHPRSPGVGSPHSVRGRHVWERSDIEGQHTS